MKKEQIVITNTELSEKEVADLCEKLSKYNSRVYIEVDDQRISATSLMGMILLSFKATYEQEVTVSADGGDEDGAITLVKEFFVK